MNQRIMVDYNYYCMVRLCVYGIRVSALWSVLHIVSSSTLLIVLEGVQYLLCQNSRVPVTPLHIQSSDNSQVSKVRDIPFKINVFLHPKKAPEVKVMRSIDIHIQWLAYFLYYNNSVIQSNCFTIKAAARPTINLQEESFTDNELFTNINPPLSACTRFQYQTPLGQDI